jgi:hypothetical protein
MLLPRYRLYRLYNEGVDASVRHGPARLVSSSLLYKYGQLSVGTPTPRGHKPAHSTIRVGRLPHHMPVFPDQGYRKDCAILSYDIESV